MPVSRVRSWFRHQPFAMVESAYYALIAIVDQHDAGVRLSADEIDAAVGTSAARTSPYVVEGGVAVVPIHGPIVPRANLFSDVSGLTSTTGLAASVRALAADPEVKAVLLDVDSPGGSAMGLPELADDLYALRAEKPLVAISRFMNGSAAYFLSSQANEVIASPSSLTGSIGVFVEHWDESGENAQMGLQPTLVHAGKYKVEGNPNEPLSEEAHGALQHMVDGFYGQFVRAVARGRGVSPDAVRSGFGQGRVLLAEDALRDGLVDRIDTFDHTLRRLQSPQGRTAATRASSADFRLRAELALLEL